MNRRKKITAEPAGATLPEIRARMADAVAIVLTSTGRDYYDELTDDELFGWATVLWDYHTDMRDEFARRELMKASHTWAGQLEQK